MIDADTRKAVFALHQEGMGLREISRRLRLGRNTVRRIIQEKGRMPPSGRALSRKPSRPWRKACR